MSDEASFEEFVAARAQALGRTAYLLTGDRQLAEDLRVAARRRPSGSPTLTAASPARWATAL